MAMNAITNLLVWAHILSPASEPVVPPQDMQAKAHPIKDPKATGNNHHNHKPTAVAAPAVASSVKDRGPLVPVTKHLKDSVQQVVKAFPGYAWTQENKALIARLPKSSQEPYEHIKKLIQECCQCVSRQKNDRAMRILFSNFELCKRELRSARARALFAQVHNIKNNK
jgi:hypothetical protein